MGDLADFLRYLKRDDVREVMLQSDRVAAVRMDKGMRPLTQEQFDTSVIVEMLIRSGLSSYLPKKDTRGVPQRVTVGADDVDIVVARQGDTLQARFARANSWTNPDAPKHPAGPEPEKERLQVSAPPVSAATADAIAPGPPSILEPVVTEAAPSAPASIRLPAATQGAPAPSPMPSHPPAAPNAAAQTYSVAPKTGEGRSIPAALSFLIKKTFELSGSALHLSAENEPRVRTLGRLRPEGERLSAAEVDALLGPLLGKEREATLKKEGYVDFALEMSGLGRLRVNVSRHRKGMKACFRTIPPKPLSLDELGLPPELRKIANYHQGLAVVSGPNGQGKTTTMAALVDLINEERAQHVITVEDPVEYIHPIKKSVMSQRQVGDHTNSFSTALKGALREDPDVIVIGELRDRETIEMALSAAETGHLVIATMSAPSASTTIGRLIDMFPPDDQAQVRATLAGALKLVIAQRLVPSVDEQRMYAAAELITGGVPLWNLIRDNELSGLPSLQQRGRNFGMIRLEDSLNELLEQKKISSETAKHYASDPRMIGQKAPMNSSAPSPTSPPPSKKGYLS